MASLLDITGSFIIGIILLFILMQFNGDVYRSNTELLYYNLNQKNLATASEILEYDLYKIGNKVESEDKFIIAAQNSIKYLSDVNNDGIIDTVYYYLGDSTEVTTSNPNDKHLYRKLNSNTPQVISTVSAHTFSYFDSIGVNEINYNDLTNPNYMRAIRGIEIFAIFETGEPVYGVYQRSELVKKIFPKNLK
jgi:hypothetical protein